MHYDLVNAMLRLTDCGLDFLKRLHLGNGWANAMDWLKGLHSERHSEIGLGFGIR